MSLQKTAISAFKWSSISQVGRQILQLLTTSVLARILSPTDFGLLGMAIVFTGFIDLFRDLGLSSSVVQKKEISNTFLYSLFWINIVFSIAATVILFIVSPSISSFYNEPKIELILKILSLNFLISGLGSLQKAFSERNLEFKALANIEICSAIIGSVAGIGCAFAGLGVWSLVFQTLIMTTVTTGFLWIITPWRPQRFFSWNDVKDVISYSLNLTGFNVFNYFIRNADNLLVGKFLGSQALGYYALAYRLMLFPLQNISRVFVRVMFPVFSKIQDDNSQLRIAYLKTISSISFITFPLMLGLVATADPLISTFFGSQWKPVASILTILAPLGMIQSIQTTLGSIYQSKGRTDLMFRWEILDGALTITAFLVGLKWGILGVAIAYVVTGFALLYPSFAIPLRLVHLSVIDVGAALWRPFLSSLLMLVSLLGLNLLLPRNLHSSYSLLILVAIGIVIYSSTSWLINREEMRHILGAIGLKKHAH